MSKSQHNSNDRGGLRALAMAMVATVLLIIFIIIALLLVPKLSLPEFEITDQQGTWRDQGEIAVFDNMIQPGSKGSYDFIIKNESEERLMYGIRLDEYLENIPVGAHPYMLYRIKFDNLYVSGIDAAGDEYVGSTWQYIGFNYNRLTIEPGSEHRMTLEWWWPFEGNDENDTLIGIAGGELSVHLFLWAEVVE